MRTRPTKEVFAENLRNLLIAKNKKQVDGKWVEYKVNSLDNPDTKGFHHYYDGYMVHYDGDGTFSYSFVVTMSDKARTFKVELDKEFTGWPEDPDPEQSKPETPDVPGESKPQGENTTGVVIALVLMALAAAAVVITAKKRA